MIFWGVFLAEFIVLFITSRFLFKSIYVLLYGALRSQKLSIVCLSLFFFPGVFVHEFSHMLVAELLQVKTHGIEFIPELSNGSLKMGSVRVSNSDIFRRLLIGVAPLLVGSAILVVSLWILTSTFSYGDIFASPLSIGISVLGLFIVFVVSNTMFSSKKDIEGLFEFLIIVAIIIPALYFAGIKIPQLVISLISQQSIVSVIQKIDIFLGIPVALNLLVVLISVPLLRRSKFFNS